MPSPDARWTAADYAPVITGSGAVKLADSQVAPLIAQARGYYTVDAPDTAKTVAESARVEGSTRSIVKKLQTMVDGSEDFLVLPWYSVSTVAREQALATFGALQLRPSKPLLNPKTKRAAKYELLAGHDSVLDTNPATPAEWIAQSPAVLITEGCLKGDAALTALLLSAGAAADDLAVLTDNAGTTASAEDARAKAQTLLLAVPPRDRVTIVSLVGVGNWHNNVEWSTLKLDNRDVLTAFDGDLRENRNVWRQASKMWDLIEKKRGIPKVVDLGGANAEKDAAVVGFVGKLGIDDYLSHVGGWPDLLHLIDDTLPPEPRAAEDDQYRPGDYRITADGLTTQEYVRRPAPDGSGDLFLWEDRLPYGARVRSVSSLHALTDITPRVGFVTEQNTIRSVKPGEAVIELSWEGDDGTTRTATITGTSELLLVSPADWNRYGAHIPDEITMLPDFPPTKGKEADGFRRAMKAHRAEETEQQDTWDTMGYVPTRSGWPVFIVGEQVLGRTRDDELANRPGVTEKVMDGVSRYGVNDTYWAFYDAGNLQGWKDQVRQDWTTIADAFIANCPWGDPAIGAIALATALRPTVPSQSITSVEIYGGPSAGKSWLGSFMMGFYASRPSAWTQHHLPGSANDTFAALEHSVARTPLFVIDDIAPKTSRQKDEEQSEKIEDLIRAKQNGNSKRRGTVDGGQRAKQLPRAVQVFTAENNQVKASIRQRMIGIPLGTLDRSSKAAEHIQDLRDSPDQPLSRLTAAMIRFWVNIDPDDSKVNELREDYADLPVPSTWAEMHDIAQVGIRDVKEIMARSLGDDVDRGLKDRRSGMFADIAFTLDVFRWLGTWAGVADDDPLIRLFTDEEGLHEKLVRYARRDLVLASKDSNTHRLMRALRELMATGKAHLEHPTVSGQRPVQSGEDADLLNRACGWRVNSRGEWEPRGETIGVVGIPTGVADAADGPDGVPELVALFSSQSAFALAQRHYPDWIPSGQRAADTWKQVWTHADGFAPANWKPDQGVQTKARLAGSGELDGTSARLRGVPVILSRMLSVDDS
ncbi:hypothetical protein [Microbacterium xylanilyticum]